MTTRRIKLNSADLTALRKLAERYFRVAAVEIKLGIRYNTAAASRPVNMNLLLVADRIGDTDLADTAAWSELRSRPVSHDAEGRAIIDLYVYERARPGDVGELLGNIETAWLDGRMVSAQSQWDYLHGARPQWLRDFMGY